MNIRNIAICKIEHNGKIFVLEGYDAKKDEVFYRPLGGGIEFGELAKEAAIREFKEELNATISIRDGFQVYENIYEYNGIPGHQVVFILDAEFEDVDFYRDIDYVGYEDNAEFKALWVDINEFTEGNKILYPTGFVSSLLKK